MQTEAMFARANLLAARGQSDAAKQAFLELLAKNPDHLGALVNFGTLLLETGYRSAARTSYERAVTVHPKDASARVNLGNLLLAELDFAAARAQFEAALAREPGHRDAHRGLAYCLDEAGEVDAAKVHRDAAFQGNPLTRLPYRGEGAGAPLLMLVAARGGNIPARFILDDRTFAVTALVADYWNESEPLPGHALLFNAIGDADLAGEALTNARRIAEKSSAPIVNPPERIVGTGRAGIAARLSGIPGLVTPKVARVARSSLTSDRLGRDGFAFPLLLRAPGFHTGRHFVRVETPDALAAAAGSLPGPELVAIQWLDARGGDGLARKYRIMCIGGALYPIHLAASRDWKVHYFTSAMADQAALRAEEARFLADMGAALGPRALAALETAAKALGLDYGGFDFALSPAGEVLLFEANATMVLNPPEPDPVWDYRRAPVGRAIDAARALFAARAGL